MVSNQLPSSQILFTLVLFSLDWESLTGCHVPLPVSLGAPPFNCILGAFAGPSAHEEAGYQVTAHMGAEVGLFSSQEAWALSLFQGPAVRDKGNKYNSDISMFYFFPFFFPPAGSWPIRLLNNSEFWGSHLA